jgi:peroxiredoxin
LYQSHTDGELQPLTLEYKFPLMKRAAISFTLLFIASMVFAQQKPEGLFINSKVQDFKAKDQNGNEVNFKDLRKKSSVVVVFYRGNWDPFCNKYLKQLQDSLQLITDNGAQLIAITPEAKEGIATTIEKTGASFPIIFDEGMKISKSFDVAFKPEERVINRYKSSGVDLLQVNHQKEAGLPVPAVFIVDKEGLVTYRFFDENYRNRASVKEIVSNLR